MINNYAMQNYNKDHMAKALGKALPISTKASIEICNTLRKKPLARAKTILKDVIAEVRPIRYGRFTNGVGHKKGEGMASGRFPVKAAQEILTLLESIEANAQFKGLNTNDMIICHIAAHNAGNSWHYGRQKRRKMKRTHIEIVVEETKKETQTKKQPVKEKKQEVK
jgi:large subunit ribosomal protein L22